MRFIRSLIILGLVPIAALRADSPKVDWKGTVFAGTPIQVQGEQIDEGAAVSGWFMDFKGDSIVIRDAAMKEDRTIAISSIEHLYVPSTQRRGFLTKVFGGAGVGAVMGLAFTATGPGAAIGAVIGIARWADGNEWAEVPLHEK